MWPLQDRFETILKEAYRRRMEEQDLAKEDQKPEVPPLLWWRSMKEGVDEEFGTKALRGFSWNPKPVYTKMVLPLDHPDCDDFFDDGSVDQHFLNQTVRIPQEEPYPTARKVLQLALNVGQGQAQGVITKDIHILDFIQATA